MSEHQKIGPYDVLEDLGEGSFGPVVSGREGPQGRPVAIKVCALEDSDLRERFLREARAASKLKHPNIAATLAVGTVGSTPYLAQELIPGPSLGEILEGREDTSLATRLDDLLMIARGLDHAYRQGIWHGDLTPNNIRRGEQGLKILDFGTARLASSETRLTQKGVTVESASYLPPEQVRGGELDHRVDLFSLGVLAFEILTYERPFRGKTLSALVYQILYKDPVDILSVWPECPPALEALIGRCLAKEPDQRHGSVAEALAELEAIRGQVGAGPVSPPPSIPVVTPGEVETTKPIATLGRRPGDPVDTKPVVARPHETVRMQQIPDEEEQISTTMPLPTLGRGQTAPGGPGPRPPAAAARPAPSEAASDPQKTQRIQTLPEAGGPPPPPNPQKTQRVSIPDPAAKPAKPATAPAPSRPGTRQPSAPPKSHGAAAPAPPTAPGAAAPRPPSPPAGPPPSAQAPPKAPPGPPPTAPPSPGSELPTVTLGKAAAGAGPPPSKSPPSAPSSRAPAPSAAKASPAAPRPAAPSAAPPSGPKGEAGKGAGKPPARPPAPPGVSSSGSKPSGPGSQAPSAPPARPAPPEVEPSKARPPAKVDPEIPTLPMSKAAPAPGKTGDKGPPKASPPAAGSPAPPIDSASDRPADLVTSAHEISQLVAKGNLQEAMAQLETIRSQQGSEEETPRKPAGLADAALGGVGAGAPAERAPEERTLSREAVAAPPTRHREPKSGPPVWMLVAGGVAALLAVVAIGWFLAGGGAPEEPEEPAIPEPPKPRVETPSDLAAPPPMGQVIVDAVPWGEIVEITNADGYLLDLPEVVQTPTSLSLEPGLYRIQVANENAAEPSQCEVDVLLDVPVECRISFPTASALEYFKDTGWWK